MKKKITDEAKQYLKKLLKEYETNIFKYVFIENSIINSVLNFKIATCKKENIDIKINIQTDFSNFEDFDICVLLSNLLDNAIEASRDLTDKAKIELIIKNDRNYLCICVKNKIIKSVLENNQELKSTKENKFDHGLGLYSVNSIVEKYDGMKSIYEENDFFIVDIRLKCFIK